MDKSIKGILVTFLAPLENHIANGGEKLLGNASSIKRRPDGRVYISGQMQRHVLFRAIEQLNEEAKKEVNIDSQQNGFYVGEKERRTGVDIQQTFVSNGDGVTNLIEKDLRADMGGFLHPSQGDYSGRRTAPLTVTPAVAIDESQVGRDLLIRIKTNIRGERVYSDGYVQTDAGEADDQKQALATKEFSEFDLMHMNFFLDISSLSISKAFKYENKFHIETRYFKHVPEVERKRRVMLFLEATRSMNDFASQARNAVSGEPQQVLIVLDTKLSRKASRYFTASASDMERKNILSELESRGAKPILGDDTKGDKGVYQAFDEAIAALASSTLYDPTGGNENIYSFEEAFNPTE